MLRFVLVDAGPAVLPELSQKLGAYAQKKLTHGRSRSYSYTGRVRLRPGRLKLEQWLYDGIEYLDLDGGASPPRCLLLCLARRNADARW